MSRAVELAKKLDIWTVEMARNQRNIEAFYHAARADMANEIISEWECRPVHEFITWLLAMADREGK